MFKYFSMTSSSKLHTFFEVAALLLCLNLLLPSVAPCESTSRHASIAVQPVGKATTAIGRKLLLRPLPATLTEAPSIMPRAGLGRSNQRTFTPDASKFFWVALNAAPCLPSLRIDPFEWDIVTPSFMLPSEHGLISFAIPPPLHA